MSRLTAVLSILACVTAQTAAAAQVSVDFRPKAEVSSLVWRSASERDAMMRHLVRTLTRLAERDLPAGQKFEAELIDVRPAGMFEPWRPNGDDVRILRDTTPPSVTLRYRLAERGRTIVSGEETVTDVNYLWDVAARSSFGSFPHETELMRDWFRDRIVRLKPKLR